MNNTLPTLANIRKMTRLKGLAREKPEEAQRIIPNNDWLSIIANLAVVFPPKEWPKRKNFFLSKFKKRGYSDKITQKHRNLAATVQFVLEKVNIKIVNIIPP